MGAPQVIYIILLIIGLFVTIDRNGETEENTPFAVLTSYVVIAALFWWGGFFAVIGIPQMAIIGAMFLSLAFQLGSGTSTYSISSSLPFSVLNIALLYLGGFFG